MPMNSRRATIGMLAIAGLVATVGLTLFGATASQAQPSKPAYNKLARELRAGGLVILVRHGATFSNQADLDPKNLADVSKQRNLNDKGKALAKSFGDAVRSTSMKIDDVYTSEFNRGYETAVLADFTGIEKTVDLSEGGLVVTPDENNRRAKALRDMLAKAPDKGKNSILITHKPNIVDALGKDWFDVKEGEASIFRPGKGSTKLVARVQMEDWPKIAAALK